MTKDEELYVLGAIGFNNPKDPYIRYPDAIAKVDTDEGDWPKKDIKITVKVLN